MAVNKVVYGGNTLIDLTGDTVEKSKLLSGYTAHDKTGVKIDGECTFDVDSQDATAAKAEILVGKTAYARGEKLTGTMPNNGAVNGSISTKEQVYNIPLGFHDGSGGVELAAAEKNKLIPTNIRQGITILGVEGTMSGSEDVKAQSKTVTPATTQKIVTPDDGYNYLSQVTVEAISYVETPNSAGGITVTIGG